MESRHEPAPLFYAIGDIHGCFEPLQRLWRRIAADAPRRLPAGAKATVVFLGDYIDRGPDSARVLEWCAALRQTPPAWCAPVFLMGNHEQLLFAFLRSRDPEIMKVWLANGGEETVASLGVQAETADELVPALTHAVARIGLSNWLPEVKAYHVAGRYLFVHAGIRPGVPLAEQKESDLLWIRERFLNSDADHGFLVIHGHTPTADRHAEVHPNRVGLDSGCCFGGALSAVRLQGDTLEVFEEPAARRDRE